MGEIEKIAESKYPKGTVFYDLVGNREFVSKGKLNYNHPNDYSKQIIYMPVTSNEFGNKSARIYKNGIWAKIKTRKNKYEIWER